MTLKYQSLYEQYRSLILSGNLRAGERLPSLRTLAQEGGHGINTVRTALELLERDGLIETLERSGSRVCLNRRFEGPKPSQQPFVSLAQESGRRLDQVMERLALKTPSFAVAAPGDDLLPLKRLQRLFASLDPSWIQYADPAGEEDLRRIIALQYQEINGKTDPQDLVISNGATEGIHLILSCFIQAGDTVVLESPAYFDYFRQLAAAKARLIEIPLKDTGSMDLDILERELKQNKVKMIICQPTVQNPSGGIMNLEDKKRLLDLAKRHDCFILQDDSYGDLHFLPERPCNLSALEDWNKLFLVSSFSKTLAPGLRVGWIRSPAWAQVLADTKLRISCATNRPAQMVLARYLEGPNYKHHLRSMRFNLARRLQEYRQSLLALFPENSQIPLPEGGCLLWIALDPRVDTTRIFEKAAQKGVLAAPGELFSANPFFRNYLRINAGKNLIPPRLRDLEILAELIRAEL